MFPARRGNGSPTKRPGGARDSSEPNIRSARCSGGGRSDPETKDPARRIHQAAAYSLSQHAPFAASLSPAIAHEPRGAPSEEREEGNGKRRTGVVRPQSRNGELPRRVFRFAGRRCPARSSAPSPRAITPRPGFPCAVARRGSIGLRRREPLKASRHLLTRLSQPCAFPLDRRCGGG